MNRKHVARRSRVLYDIRASPQPEWCRHRASHLFTVNAYHHSRDELQNKVIPTISQMRSQGSADGHLLLPVQSARHHFDFFFTRNFAFGVYHVN
jgi:hypothetical protein